MFLALTVLAWGLVVGLAAWRRGRLFATFAAVILGIHGLLSVGLWSQAGAWWPLFVYGQVAAYAHFGLLVTPRMRGLGWRLLINWPGSLFVAACFLGMPWALASGLGFEPWGVWIPFALAGIGLFESLVSFDEVVDVTLDGAQVEGLRRHQAGRRQGEGRPLRIVQLTDPHLGPFMSEARLRQLAQRAVEHDPDLVLLTGDFMTMESHHDPELIRRALAPLEALKGRTFACFGNHDHEDPESVMRALSALGIKLLVDDAEMVETPAGVVQVVGMDFAWRERRARMEAVCRAHPRVEGVPRLVMLHDPGAFEHLPPGEADLVFSGHTHGGQLGLLRLGLPWTAVSLLSRVPDHGLWARGTDRLYVHRGNGHYGFPLRLGVPSEQSLLQVWGALPALD